MEAEIYQSLAGLNQASAEIVAQSESLRDAGVLTLHFAELCILASKQNCAEINVSVVHHLAQAELDSATRLQNERAEKQQELAQR